MKTKTSLNHKTPPAAKPLLGEVHLLTDKQLTDAFHILFGNDWKKYWNERDKAAEMRSIFNGRTQPCCPFANWVKLMEYLASHFPNGSGIAKSKDLEAESFNLTQMPNKITND